MEENFHQCHHHKIVYTIHSSLNARGSEDGSQPLSPSQVIPFPPKLSLNFARNFIF